MESESAFHQDPQVIHLPPEVPRRAAFESLLCWQGKNVVFFLTSHQKRWGGGVAWKRMDQAEENRGEKRKERREKGNISETDKQPSLSRLSST